MVALDDFLRSFRKFHCSVYMATQQLDLPAELRSSIFTNCSRFFAFAGSAADATFLGKEFGGADGALVAERLPELKTGQAFVKVRGEPARLLHVETVTPPSTEQITRGRANCFRLGRSRAEIDTEIEQRRQRFTLSNGTSKPDPKRDQDQGTDTPEGYEGF